MILKLLKYVLIFPKYAKKALTTFFVIIIIIIEAKVFILQI